MNRREITFNELLILLRDEDLSDEGFIDALKSIDLECIGKIMDAFNSIDYEHLTQDDIRFLPKVLKALKSRLEELK